MERAKDGAGEGVREVATGGAGGGAGGGGGGVWGVGCETGSTDTTSLVT